MAPLKYVACAVTFLLHGGIGGEAAAPTAAGNTDDCLLGLNLERTGQLSINVGVLKKSTKLEAAASTAITSGSLAGNDDAACALKANTTPVSAGVEGMLLTYPQTEQLDCTALIQTQLNDALAALGNYNGEVKWNNGSAAPYNDSAVQNLAYSVFAEATEVGCAGTNNCTGGTNVVVCRFTPSLSAAFGKAPFSVDFFKALVQRKDAGVDLTKLGANDVDTKPAGSGVPGVVPASAGLTFVTLLGLASFHP